MSDHKKFRKLHEYTVEHDIRYRGPLSYQSLMILGWLMIVFSVVRVLLLTMIGSDNDPQLVRSINPFVPQLSRGRGKRISARGQA